jgi:hypothetical protein
MLKYLTKIFMDIFPSVLATIIGAYIVNHYINARPAPDTPAAAVAPAQTKKDAKPAEVANLPAPGVKAKGISEKTVTDKPAAEKPADNKAADNKAADNKAADQPAEAKPAETAPAETAAAPRGRPTASRDSKAMAKATPAPVLAAPASETTQAPDATVATPDANDLARAAIERLRKSPEVAPTAHAPELPRAQEAPRLVTAAPPSVRPLPPPITVSTPGPEAYGSPSNPSYTASVGWDDDANRLTPPADIPVPVVVAPPLDLRADAASPMSRPKTNVADEMLSGVKSMFHAVLPKSVTPD